VVENLDQLCLLGSYACLFTCDDQKWAFTKHMRRYG